MKKVLCLVLFTVLLLQGLAFASYYKAEYIDDGAGNKKLVCFRFVTANKDFPELKITTLPNTIIEHAPAGPETRTVLCSSSEEEIRAELAKKNVAVPEDNRLCNPHKLPRKADNETSLDELIVIQESGSPYNRIPLVFLGDGYTQAERELFLSDINRLIDEMIAGEAYHSYIPISLFLIFMLCFTPPMKAASAWMAPQRTRPISFTGMPAPDTGQYIPAIWTQLIFQPLSLRIRILHG